MGEPFGPRPGNCKEMKRRGPLLALTIGAIAACGDASSPAVESSPGTGGAPGSISAGSGMTSGSPNGGGSNLAGSTGNGAGSDTVDAGAGGAGGEVRDGSFGADSLAGDAGVPKPRVWISSDLTNPNSTNATDTDDIVTTAAFLLLSNRFAVEGFVVGATPYSSCVSSLAWVKTALLPVYLKEIANLEIKIGGYSNNLPFLQASTCQKKFDPSATVDVDALPTVRSLIDAAKTGPLFVLNWGPMDETASAISGLLATGDTATLDRITVISHWTSPSNQYNCSVDANACAYVHQQAAAGKVKLYELGPMGQTGLVDNSCKTSARLNQATMYGSEIGNLMSIKWNGDGWPDMSDGATFLVLAGFGGGVTALKADGTFDSAGLNRLCNDRSKIATLLEAAAIAAAGM
jgi:hypothetical protein